MISYENYENRIKRLAKFKGFVTKFKFLIIGVLALILAAATVILVIKGMVMSPVVMPESIIYGDDYSPDGATAIMSGVSYEYAPADGGEWTQTKPVKAGKYLVRAVTDRVFGIKGHGGEVAYEISPKDAEFKIFDTAVTYGENPADCTVTPLVYGDKLDLQSLKFDFASFTSTQTEVEVDLNSVVILDTAGGDSSSCYNLTADSVEIKFLQRYVNVSPAPVTVTYAGKKLSYEAALSDLTKSMLAEGDTVTYDTVLKDAGGQEVDAPQAAGTYTLEIVPTSIRIFKGGVEVTERYGISQAPAPLKVNKKDITVTTATASKVFDTFALSDASCEQTGLIDGHTLVRNGQNAVTITNAGSILNVYSYEILDENGENVTANYQPNVIYGTLTVEPKPVYVTTAGATKTYDGAPLSNPNAEYEGLIEGYSLQLVGNYSITDAGESDNMLDFTVKDANGGDAKGNFELIFTYGKLKVERREITIHTESGSKVYDATPLYKISATVDSSTPLAAGDTLALATPYTITDAAENVKNVTTYYVYSGLRNVTKNYDISYIYGLLTISPRKITVQTTTNSAHVYDGNEFFDYRYQTYNFENKTEEGLLGLDALAPSSYTKITNAGSVRNVCAYSEPNGNYIIADYEYGTLTVQPRPIVIQTATAEKYYDGTALYNAGYTTSCGNDAGLIGNDTLTFLTGTEITNAGSAQNICTYSLPDDNYTIDGYTYGTLTVKPRKIAVYTESDAWEYDGAPHSNPNYTTCNYFDGSQAGLLYGETLTLTYEHAVTNVLDNSENVCKYDVPNGNYEIAEYQYGSIIINPRPIIVETNSGTHIYDATAYFDTGYKTYYYTDKTAEGLIGSDKLSIRTNTEITNVGTVTNACTYGGNANYKIMDYEYGTLEVTPRPICVNTVYDVFTYDASAHYNYGYTTNYYGKPEEAGLLNGDTLTVRTYAKITDAGAASNVCAYTSGANYEIKDYTYGTLNVLPRPIAVKTVDDSTHIYDATAYKNYGYSTCYYDDSEKAGLLNGDKLTVKTYTEILNAGSMENACTYDVPNGNYVIFRYEYGTLNVQPRPITVVTASDSKEYDGTPLYNNTYTTHYYGDSQKAGLLNGDEIEVYRFMTVTAAGSKSNICAYDVPKNDYGNYNYEIKDYEYGALTVTPRPIIVATASGSFVYDGTAQSAAGYSALYAADRTPNGLLNGDYLTVLTYTKITDVGTAQNVCTYVPPVNVFGNYNYEIVGYEYGKLEVTPRPICVNTVYDVFTYDAAAHYNYGYTTNYYGDSAKEGLLNGDTLTVKTYTEITNAGSASNECTYTSGANYEIKDYTYGTLTVLPRPIVVKTVDDSTHIYDATAYKNYGYTTYLYGYPAQPGLLNGDTLTVKTSTDIINAGSMENACTYDVPNGNYLIFDYEYGTLTVQPRPITVATASDKKEYDGAPLSNSNYTTYYFGDSQKAGLLNGDSLDLVGEPAKITNVWETSSGNNTCEYAANSNYEIKDYEYGTLTVEKRQIVVGVLSVNLIYGETDFYPSGANNYTSAGGASSAQYSPAEGEELEIAVYYINSHGGNVTPKDAGSYYIRLDKNNCKIYKEGVYFERGTENYDIVDYSYGVLEIAPRPITIEPCYMLLTYGEKIAYPSGANNFENPEASGLQYDDTLTLSVVYMKNGGEVTPKNVGKYDICAVSGATLINGVADTSNYEITYIEGTLEIVPAALYIYVDDLQFIYGQPVVYPAGAGNYKDATGLQYGETAEISVYFTDANGLEVTPKSAGNYTIIATESATLIDGVNDTSNYEITYISGALEITRKDITVELIDIAPVTYGQTLSYPDGVGNFANVDTCGLEYGEQLEIAAYFRSSNNDYFSTAVNADTYAVCYVSGFVYDENGRKLGLAWDNYNVSCAEKTTRIAPKQIEIKPVELDGLIYGQTPEYPSTNDNYILVSGGTAYDESIQIFVEYLQGGTVVTPKNAGEYTVKIIEGATLVDGVADTSNYDIICGTSTLKIEARRIAVTTASGSKVYDGTAYSDAGYVTQLYGNPDEDGLINGDTLTVISYTEITNAGSEQNVCNYSAGANYIIEDINYGTLTVTPRPIIVVTASESKAYDGTPLSNATYTTYLENFPSVAGLVGGDLLTLLGTAAEITNVWDSADNNNVNAYGEPNGNYEIVGYEYGTLIITPREITVVMNEIDPVIYGDIPTYTGGINNFRNTAFIDLAAGEQLEVKAVFMLGGAAVTPKDAGDYTVHMDRENSLVYAASGALIENGIKNYSITCDDHTATISLRQITVTPADMTNVTYDGNYHTHGGGCIIQGELAYGETLTLRVEYFKDAAQTQKVTYPVDAGTYYVYTALGCMISDKGSSTLYPNKNYDIVRGFTEFEIEKRALTVTLGDVSKVYDGTDYDFAAAPSTAFAVAGLVGSDVLKRTVTYSATPLNAGTYTVYYDLTAYALTSGNADNYYVDDAAGKLYCTLEIEKRQIYIDVNYRAVEYTGNPVNPADDSFVSYTADSAAGFVNSDGANAGAVFTYNGTTVPPTEKGTYTLGVTFTAAVVMNNYKVISTKTNYLDITPRQVGVVATYSGGITYYNGESVSLVNFGFTSWHAVANPAAGDEYGFAASDLAAISASYTFTNAANPSDVYKNGASPVNAGNYIVEIELAGYDKNIYFVIYDTLNFTIQKRPITVTLGDLTHIYNNAMPDAVPDIANSFSLDASEAGILAKDAAKYAVNHTFRTNNGGAVTRYNAGTYQIYATLSLLTSEDNYVISNVDTGTLTITPAPLYVKPVDKAEYYNGKNISIAPTEYEIFGSDERGAFALAGGDYLFIEADKELAPTKSSATITVARAWVRDAYSANGTAGNDITSNYDIRTAYTSDMGEDYEKSSFKASLEFLQRTVYIDQIVPAGQSEFCYTGEYIYIEYSAATDLFNNVTSVYGGMGLYAGHYLDVKTARVGKEVGVYTEWLTLKVLDGDGNDVTKVYDIICKNGGTSSIEVKAIGLSVNISPSVTAAAIADGSVVTSSPYDGRNILVADAYTIEGLPEGYAAEIAVEGNTLKVLVFEIRTGIGSGSRKDRQDGFTIISVNSPAGITVVKSALEE